MSELNPDDESTLKSPHDHHSRQQLNNSIDLCGTNRLAHVDSLAPSIPCHLIVGYVTTLSGQISRLLVSFY